MHHINVVEENLQGSDLLIGDIHGSYEAFKKVINSLKPNDRLFSVGDIWDRGEDSLGVIRDMVEFQKDHPNRLYVTRGNHENICFNCIEDLNRLVTQVHKELDEDINRRKQWNPKLNDADIEKMMGSDRYNILKRINKEIEKFNNYNPNVHKPEEKSRYENIGLHHINGGEWLIKLYIKELDDHKIQINETGTIQYNNSNVEMVRDFIQALPYFTHVKGEIKRRPFNVVHADNPFSDEELQKRIENRNFTLSAEEIFYIIWARQFNRIIRQIMTYVGHNQISNHMSVVRELTNTIDLDVSAFKNRFLLVANHTMGSCYYMPAADLADGDFAALRDPVDESQLIEHIQHWIFHSDEAYILNGNTLYHIQIEMNPNEEAHDDEYEQNITIKGILELDDLQSQQINDQIRANIPEEMPVKLTDEMIIDIIDVIYTSGMYRLEKDKLNKYYESQLKHKADQSSTSNIHERLDANPTLPNEKEKKEKEKNKKEKNIPAAYINMFDIIWEDSGLIISNINEASIQHPNKVQNILECIQVLEKNEMALELIALAISFKYTIKHHVNDRDISQRISKEFKKSMQELKEFMDDRDQTIFEHIDTFITNGSEQLIKLYLKELMEGKIRWNDKDDKMEYKDDSHIIKMINDLEQQLSNNDLNTEVTNKMKSNSST